MRASASLIFVFSLTTMTLSRVVWGQAEGSLWNGRDSFRDIRWLGRGNTGIATTTDGAALFANPAGLGIREGYNFSLVSSSVGLDENFYSTGKTLASALKGADTINERFAPFLGKSFGGQFSFFPHLVIPSFGLGYFKYADLNAIYRNPVNPELRIDGRNDRGVIIGTGFGYKNYFSLGVSLRYEKRSEIREVVTGGSLVTLLSRDLTSFVKKGEAFAINVGVMTGFKPNSFTWLQLGAAIEDVGDTRWRNPLGNTPPLKQGAQVNLGLAYGLQTTLVDGTLFADFRKIQRGEISMTKRVHLGAEVTLLKTDIRGGLFQGYWTAGASIRFLPLFDLDFASYGEEVATAAGLRENRYYVVGANFGIGLKKGGKKQKKYRSQLDAL